MVPKLKELPYPDRLKKLGLLSSKNDEFMLTWLKFTKVQGIHGLSMSTLLGHSMPYLSLSVWQKWMHKWSFSIIPEAEKTSFSIGSEALLLLRENGFNLKPFSLRRSGASDPQLMELSGWSLISVCYQRHWTLSRATAHKTEKTSDGRWVCSWTTMFQIFKTLRPQRLNCTCTGSASLAGA